MQGTWRVLLIDDYEDDNIPMDGMLVKAKGRNIEIEWAPNHEVAKQQIEANHFDAVLVDYRLGRHTSIELILELTNRAYHALAILMTGTGTNKPDRYKIAVIG